MEMLIEAMSELEVGNPFSLTTDIGPVIDSQAKNTLLEHLQKMQDVGEILYQCKLDDVLECGNYVSPTVFKIAGISQLEKEVFGPILHVIEYDSDKIDWVIDQINSTEYGLTLRIHSRIDSFAELIIKRTKVGNIYVNRDMIGAVVGVQPFGGEGLSGTGPKAGGPSYLRCLSVERTYTVNTAAIGGNASLLSKSDD